MTTVLSEDELAARRPVWEALAEFWLDTELQDFEFDYIARVIAESPYSIEEVMAIHRYEVAPAVSANLMSMAGEWAGFDKAWLESTCHAQALKRHSARHRLRFWLQTPFLKFFTGRYWSEVIPRVQALRSGGARGG